MARHIVIAPHLTVAELEQRYRRAGDPVARSQWQILWLPERGHVRLYGVRDSIDLYRESLLITLRCSSDDAGWEIAARVGPLW